MISCSFPPAIGTTHTCGVLVFAFKSTSTAAKSTHFPSGEGTGSPTRLSAIMSSKVKGCLVWGKEGRATQRTDSRSKMRRISASGKEPENYIQNPNLSKNFADLALVNDPGNPRKILIHHAIFLHLGRNGANGLARLLPAFAGLEWRDQVHGLRCGHCFDGQNIARIVDDAPELKRRRHAHGNVIFFVA